MTTFEGAPITDATVAEFTRQMQERGLDPSVALAKHGIGNQQQASPAPAPEPAPLAPDLNAAKHPRLTGGQLQAAADNISKHWTGDPAVLRETLERMGLQKVDTAHDPRTEMEQQFDATLGAPASPDDYALPDLLVGRTGLDLYEAAKVASTVRTALGEMHIPKHLASTLGNAILDASEHGINARTTPEARQQYSNEQVSLACKVLNVGRQELFSTIKPLIANLSPQSREFLMESNAADNANVLAWLFRSAELATIRRGLEKSRG